MSKRKRVILHIGMLKTGTTSLQAYLRKNKDVIAAQSIGFYLPNFTLLNPSSNAGFLCWAAMDEARGKEINPLHTKEMLRFTEYSRAYDTLILSEEFMWEKGIDEPYFWEVVRNNIARMLGDDAEIFVIAFIRRQDNWILSRWKECLLSCFVKETSDFADFVRMIEHKRYMNYDTALTRISQIFGRDHVRVCGYDTSSNSRFDTIKAFGEAANIELNKETRPIKQSKNISISMRAAKALLIINSSNYSTEITRGDIARAARTFSLMYPDDQKYYPMEIAERTKFLGDFRNVNARVASEYNCGTPFFTEAIEDYCVWQDNSSMAKADATIILKLATLSRRTMSLFQDTIGSLR